MIIKSLKQYFRRHTPSSHPRVFAIGFNKCGTKTLHGFLSKNGVASAHYYFKGPSNDTRHPIAITMRDNINFGRPVLTGMEHYRAFSDMMYLHETEVIEANSFFREIYAEHPDSFFILNDRPIEDWIKSRLNHDNGPGGSFVDRYAKALGVGHEALPDIWREQYLNHVRAVTEFFHGHERFLHFDITQSGPETLKSFFGEKIPMQIKHWEKLGTAEQRARKFK